MPLVGRESALVLALASAPPPGEEESIKQYAEADRNGDGDPCSTVEIEEQELDRSSLAVLQNKHRSDCRDKNREHQKKPWPVASSGARLVVVLKIVVAHVNSMSETDTQTRRKCDVGARAGARRPRAFGERLAYRALT